MVRFKVSLCDLKALRIIVSIPIWFDLKKYANAYLRLNSKSFNSYMVRFKELGAQFRALFIKGFNSYMVRFKAEIF